MSRAVITARDLIHRIVDPNSFVCWDTPPERGAISEAYAAQLVAAAQRSGEDESLITGEALVRGRRVALVAGEFTFLAGSIGVAASRRLIAAIERATAEGLPLLASPTSGGTRMQAMSMCTKLRPLQ